ncbi:MAG TPA: TetR/AcrR family transcriptional regulator [Chloroflexota bacterium]|nr:TetR/AcrR family transcriptional regulator [Chloroflexota bacterium]
MGTATGEARRQAILAAARALLAESPAPSVTLDAIAARAGTTKATLYRYFPSKRSLLAAACGESEEAAEAVARRDQILDATMAVVVRYGLHGATMERIAAAAGVSAPALYWHFKNKDELFLAMIQRLASRVQAALLAELGPDSDLTESIQRLVARAIVLQAEQIELIRVVLAEGTSRPRLLAALGDQLIGPLWARLAAYLDAQVAAGHLRPGDGLLRIVGLAGMITYYNLVRRTFGDRLPLPGGAAAAGEFTRIFLHGVLNGPRSRE